MVLKLAAGRASEKLRHFGPKILLGE